jgi:hypothetical protein
MYMELLHVLVNPFEAFFYRLLVSFVLQYLLPHPIRGHVPQSDGFGDKIPSIN